MISVLNHQLESTTEGHKHGNAFKLCGETAYYTCLLCGFDIHPISNRGQASGHILLCFNYKNALFGISRWN